MQVIGPSKEVNSAPSAYRFGSTTYEQSRRLVAGRLMWPVEDAKEGSPEHRHIVGGYEADWGVFYGVSRHLQACGSCIRLDLCEHLYSAALTYGGSVPVSYWLLLQRPL